MQETSTTYSVGRHFTNEVNLAFAKYKRIEILAVDKRGDTGTVIAKTKKKKCN